MATNTVRAEWVRDQMFLLTDRNQFPIVMTQPQGANGADLLPMSLIGCAAWDVISILQKQREAVTGLEVIAESEQDAEPPWRFRKIHIVYRVAGRDLSEEHVRRAVELSEQKYCSIFATLRACVEIDSRVEIAAE